MVSSHKVELVQTLAERIKASPIVGIVNMENLPAPQLRTMKSLLRRQEVSMTMARKSLLARAIAQSGKKNIEQLSGKMKGMPALIFSKSNPFTLYKTIQKNQSEAPAKPGQKAPHDITVKAGPTNFAPGPIISELAAVGIKTKVEAGKLAILSDTVIVREGQTISPKVAETLKRLDIKPMRIGLNIVAVWENGLLFDAKQLHIDEAEFSASLTQAAQWAMSLALEAAYAHAETITLLLQKAHREAKAVAEEGKVLTSETVGELAAQAEREARALQDAGGIVIPAADEENAGAGKREEKREQSAPEERAENLPEAEKDESAPAPREAKLEGGAPELHGAPHPKQGRVTSREAEILLAELQKKGTLRT